MSDTKLTYALNTDSASFKKDSTRSSAWANAKEFFVFLKGDGMKLVIAFIMILINSGANVVTPYLIARALDTYIAQGNLTGLSHLLLLLAGLYVITVFAGYLQGILVGNIAQRTLFRLREALFNKLQQLPIAFFNQNKSGDLMSRINNDTDKLNQFISQSLARFVGSFFSLFGIAVFTLFINFKLAVVMLSVTVLLFIITKMLSPWIERQNKKSLTTIGNLSSSLQENITNFRVIVAYSKRDYFRSHLERVNQSTFDTALRSGTANRIFEPIYDFAGAIALIAVLSYGLQLISTGSLTIGLLVAFVSYTQKFYDPLRILATIFGTIQISTAAWSRIREVFGLKNNLQMSPTEEMLKTVPKNNLRMELNDVSFGYEDNRMVIENATLAFEAGKTYALVGPTGGGKSTLASLMAHLYDPTSGVVYLNSKPICSYTHEERAQQISVILQDPILFSGTVADNIRYGNDELKDMSNEELKKLLDQKGFSEVIERFDGGLQTVITQGSGVGLSIGQKQLVSFMRAILRQPLLLILDEATANIDTVTEALLNKTLEALPKETTKVIIAHRLNTIKEADEIMFVNGHHVTKAGSFDNAISLIESSKRTS